MGGLSVMVRQFRGQLTQLCSRLLEPGMELEMAQQLSIFQTCEANFFAAGHTAPQMIQIGPLVPVVETERQVIMLGQTKLMSTDLTRMRSHQMGEVRNRLELLEILQLFMEPVVVAPAIAEAMKLGQSTLIPCGALRPEEAER